MSVDAAKYPKLARFLQLKETNGSAEAALFLQLNGAAIRAEQARHELENPPEPPNRSGVLEALRDQFAQRKAQAEATRDQSQNDQPEPPPAA